MITEAEARAARLEPLTVWRIPNYPIETDCGTMRYDAWCKREAGRLKRRAEVVVGKGARVSLWASRVL